MKNEKKTPFVDNKQAKASGVVAVRRHLALLVYVQRRVAGGGGVSVSRDATEPIESWCREA